MEIRLLDYDNDQKQIYCGESVANFYISLEKLISKKKKELKKYCVVACDSNLCKNGQVVVRVVTSTKKIIKNED